MALLFTAAANADDNASPKYAIVVSQRTLNDPQWKLVVDTLQTTHQGQIITYENLPNEALGELKSSFPRYTCFVATPQEATREFVAQVHQLTRTFDDDPYTDTFWGILTGYDAGNAVRIAATTEPLTIRKVASGTELAMDRVEEGVWYCELKQSRMVQKAKGEEAQQATGPKDTTKALVDTLNDYHADLFVTSGHATERDWQIGFAYRNGSFRCEDGKLYGLDTQNVKHPVESDNPKVYMPIGNCLMGHIDSQDAMALAYMNSAGVTQMLGYTVPTWFGYGGWGCLDYFVEQPGRYTFVEAFFANHHALMHKLQSSATPANERRGLEFDRDVVAIYGDPAWQAKMAEGKCNWEQELNETNGTYTLTIRPTAGNESFATVNKNGSQRGGRPMIAYLPHRVTDVKVISGAELQPVITDDFVLVPLPGGDVQEEYRVVFQAKPL
jgi:zinc protease